MITVSYLHETFRRIIDETQTDYFTDSEVDQFLSDAQMSLFKRYTSPDGLQNKIPGKNSYYESSFKASEYIRPFMNVVSGTMSAGLIDNTKLQSLVNGKNIFLISGLSVLCDVDGKYHPAMQKSHSQSVKQLGMAFHEPLCCNPHFTMSSQGIHVLPDTSLSFKATLVAYPDDISLSGSIGSDFPDALKNVIPYTAAQLASLSIRDTEFTRSITETIELIGV